MRASEWRITWDPAGESPRVLLDHGDTMEDELARSLSQMVDVGKFDFLASGRPASRGNMKQRLEFSRRIAHTNAVASWQECSAQIAAAPWGETGLLRIEPRQGMARAYIAALMSSTHRPMIDGPQPESLHEYSFRVRLTDSAFPPGWIPPIGWLPPDGVVPPATWIPPQGWSPSPGFAGWPVGWFPSENWNHEREAPERRVYAARTLYFYPSYSQKVSDPAGYPGASSVFSNSRFNFRVIPPYAGNWSIHALSNDLQPAEFRQEYNEDFVATKDYVASCLMSAVQSIDGFVEMPEATPATLGVPTTLEGAGPWRVSVYQPNLLTIEMYDADLWPDGPVYKMEVRPRMERPVTLRRSGGGLSGNYVDSPTSENPSAVFDLRNGDGTGFPCDITATVTKDGETRTLTTPA